MYKVCGEATSKPATTKQGCYCRRQWYPVMQPLPASRHGAREGRRAGVRGQAGSCYTSKMRSGGILMCKSITNSRRQGEDPKSPSLHDNVLSECGQK